MSKLRYAIVFILFISWSCSDNSNSAIDQSSLDALYEQACEDVKTIEEDEIFDNLIAVTDSNNYLVFEGEGSEQRVLALTWTKYDTYNGNEGDTIETWWGKTWVTLVPELKDFFEYTNLSEDELNLRLEQLLGLPYNNGNLYFAELWVKPEDLLRPSYDNEIDDSAVELSFPENSDEDYIIWFYENMISSYYSDFQYPWTRLGYTYDWNNPETEVGLSEFLIKENSKVIVHSSKPTGEYIYSN